MEKELSIINELLKGLNVSPIVETEAKEWQIEGGESFEELNNMAKCYAGTIEEEKIRTAYYRN